MLEPVLGAERFASLDVLRGVALLGILLVNIQHFATFSGGARDPWLFGEPTGLDLAVLTANLTLVTQRFMPIFAMLFGAGIAIAADRCAARGGRPAALHYRRMLVLWLLGAGHAYLIWYGDVVTGYALCGLLVFLLRRWNPWAQLAVGAFLILLPLPIHLVLNGIPPLRMDDPGSWSEGMRTWTLHDFAAFRGEWTDQLAMRVQYAWEFQTKSFLAGGLWRASGLMLLGMALTRFGFLTGLRSRRFYMSFAGATILPSLVVIVVVYAANHATEWDRVLLVDLFRHTVLIVGVPASLGYASLLLAVREHRFVARLLRPVAAVGRMAFTNYILTSVLCTAIFYGDGWVEYGTTGPAAQFVVVLGVWAVQLGLSSFWLRHFRFGPVEWLSRSLAYWRVQPWRRTLSPPLRANDHPPSAS